MKYQKSRKKITSKIYNQLTRSEPNWLLLAQSKINPSKISDFPAVAQKEVTNARDVEMETVHLSVF